MGEEKHENETVSVGASIELRAFKLPVRTRQNTYVINSTISNSNHPYSKFFPIFSAFRFPERRRQDNCISKRRDMPSILRNTRGLKRTLTSEGGIHLKEISSTDSYTESDMCDSNESLANLGEIEDSVDSPLV